MLCVYGIAGARVRARGRGAAREPLRIVRAGRLTAVVGGLAAALPPTRTALVRFDQVVRRVAATNPVLLPVRFGTYVENELELVTILERRQPSLRASLRHIRNRAQMTVRLLRWEPAPAVDRRPRGATPRSGTRFLQERAAAANEAKNVPQIRAVRGAVARWVRDEQVEIHHGIATVYHLIPRSSAARYARALERAAVARDLRIVVTGPWPAYAFAAGVPVARASRASVTV